MYEVIYNGSLALGNQIYGCVEMETVLQGVKFSKQFVILKVKYHIGNMYCKDSRYSIIV